MRQGAKRYTANIATNGHRRSAWQYYESTSLPESQLYPNLFVVEEPFLKPTESFLGLIDTLRDISRMTPALARAKAAEYLTALRAELKTSLPPQLTAPTFVITEDVDLIARQQLVALLFANSNVTEPHTEASYLLEVFWLVPIALALQLQKAGHFLVALDCYQTVYAFNLPPQNRKIYRGLELEGGIASVYDRVPEWLLSSWAHDFSPLPGQGEGKGEGRFPIGGEGV